MYLNTAVIEMKDYTQPHILREEQSVQLYLWYIQ